MPRCQLYRVYVFIRYTEAASLLPASLDGLYVFFFSRHAATMPLHATADVFCLLISLMPFLYMLLYLYYAAAYHLRHTIYYLLRFFFFATFFFAQASPFFFRVFCHAFFFFFRRASHISAIDAAQIIY